MRIVITIEDVSSGVKMTARPSMESIAHKNKIDPDAVTPAEHYAQLVGAVVATASRNITKLGRKNIITPGDFL